MATRRPGRTGRLRPAATGLLAAALVAGCSAVMATKQPGKKDLDVLQRGTPRVLVLRELGWPSHTSTDATGECEDYYSFTQGYSTSVKAGRAVFHGVADLFTLFLWELIGMPTELYFDGTKVSLMVHYDEEERVETVCVFAGGEVVDVPHVRGPLPEAGESAPPPKAGE